MTFSRTGAGYEGSFSSAQLRVVAIPFARVRYDAPELRWELVGDESTMAFEGDVRGDTLAGRFHEGAASGTFTLTRGPATAVSVKLPHHLVASFRATLEEAREADVLLHVVDASHPEYEEQVEVVESVLGELELDDRPVIMVFNKSDLLTDPEAFAERVREVHPGAVTVNSVRPGGLDELIGVLAERAKVLVPTVRLVVPATDGKMFEPPFR